MTHYLSRDPFTVPPMQDLEAAWDELLATLPPGWQVGRPAWNERRQEWSLYAWDGAGRPSICRRAGEWTAVPSAARFIRADLPSFHSRPLKDARTMPLTQ